jgi:DNA-directed RNA polymerase subunit RPC12/RpoP
MEDLHCAYCSEDFPEDKDIGDIETTHQQWRCPCCGSWNDRTDTQEASDAALP